MPISNEELDRMADDIYKDRRISGSLYCANCGYNLRTLPRSYACPECGNEYSARPTSMKGIYFPHDVLPPYGWVAGTLLFGVISAALIASALKPFERGQFALGLVFAALTAWCLFLTYCRFLRLERFRHVAKRIARQEED